MSNDTVVIEDQTSTDLSDDNFDESNAGNSQTDNSAQLEYSDVEIQAMERGWKPEEHFKSSTGKKWRDAETFMEIYHVKEESKALRQSKNKLEKTLDNFSGYIETVRSAERDKTLRELKEKRNEAIEEGNVQLTNQYDELIDQQKKIPTKPPISEDKGLHPEAEAFISRNQEWFNQSSPKNTSMVSFAQALETEILTKNPNIDLEDLYEKIEQEVKSTFNPESVQRSRNMSQKIATPSGRGAPAQKGSRLSRDLLTREEQSIMDSMIGQKIYNKVTKKLESVISEQEYLKSLVDSGAIKINAK